MRRTLWLAVLSATAAISVFPATVQCQQQDQAKASQQSSGSQNAGTGATQSTTQTPPAPQESLAEAARRAREQKKDTPTQAKVFTNDNIPKEGGISAVGTNPTPPPDNPADAAAATTDASQLAAAQGTGEKQWRDRFAKLRHKLEQDQADLDIMERELGVLDVQNYSDPVKAMQQGLTRSDINDKTAKIEAKKKQIEADKQAISDAEDDLRKAGGDPGWAR